MRLLALPPYAPELNPVGHLWDELREKCFHNKAFNSIDALEPRFSIRNSRRVIYREFDG